MNIGSSQAVQRVIVNNRQNAIYDQTQPCMFSWKRERQQPKCCSLLPVMRLNPTDYMSHSGTSWELGDTEREKTTVWYDKNNTLILCLLVIPREYKELKCFL